MVIACSTDIKNKEIAAKIIYKDDDVKQYICIDELKNCDINQFTSKLNITFVNLNAVKKL